VGRYHREELVEPKNVFWALRNVLGRK
jgi:hypothetical protein